MFRGSLKPGRDLEMQILKYLPGVAMFIEKPIATGLANEISDGFTIAKTISDSKTVCSVGQVLSFSPTYSQTMSLLHRRYMLRYLKAVQMMKQIIEENNLTVMSTIARYACAYEAIAKPDWWDKSRRSVRVVSVNID
jgi:predicted dehydrogenase